MCTTCLYRVHLPSHKAWATTRPGLVAALTYWSARAIREQYLKNPGPLVQA
jgi:hypothetical protein